MRLTAVHTLTIEPVGEDWAVFDESSGETHLLNDESMMILGVLQKHVLDEYGVAEAVAGELGVSAEPMRGPVRVACDALRGAGLLVRV